MNDEYFILKPIFKIIFHYDPNKMFVMSTYVKMPFKILTVIFYYLVFSIIISNK